MAISGCGDGIRSRVYGRKLTSMEIHEAEPVTIKDRSGLAHYAFKTAISLTDPAQATMLERAFGMARFAYDTFFPSSKTCRLCGVKNQDLTLADRVFRCPSPGCGHEEDRDIHAARNIQHQALKLRVPGATGEFTPVESCSLPARPSGLAGKTARRSRKRSPLGVAMSNASRRQNSDGQVQNA
jgi:hypothetical protein